MSRYLVATVKDFGELIRGFRKQRGWTQARLAERAGMLPKTVSAIETGSGQVLLVNVMRCLSTLEVALSLDSGTDHGTMQVPAPTDVRPTLDSVGVHTNQVSSRRRASTGLFASTPPGKQARKTSKEGIASHTASATKALKEKW
jgi:HTH-type transcriptional regulator/antitoxin HipB